MKLNERDIELFKALNVSQAGKDLVDFLRRLVADVMDADSLTPENLTAKKEAVNIIKKELIQRIELQNEPKAGATSYE